MTRTLVIMGSGETTPTMVTTHQRVFGSVAGDRPALLLDTPYGFQANADEISAKARAYFAHNVGREVEVLGLRRATDLTPVREEDVVAQAREAGWLFAGPGSPTYLARQLRATSLPAVLRDRLAGGGSGGGGGRGGATVVASAAACTLGAKVIPVYEIYKAGHDLHWADGLDLLAGLDLGTEHPLDVVVVPHFDNTEGGTHDTRYCYLGAHRLAAMEAELPASTWVLGVDEHTALVAELDTGAVRIEGRGGVTVRARDHVVRFEAGTATTLAALIAAAHAGGGARGPVGTAAPTSTFDTCRDNAEVAAPTAAGAAGSGSGSPLLDEVAAAAARFDAALADGRVLDAAEVTVELDALLVAWSLDVLESDELDQARVELRRQVVGIARVAQAGLHEHRDLVAPHVEALLDLRERARSDRRFDDADAIRDALHEGGVEVQDAPTGTRWAYRDPVTGRTPAP